MNKKHLLLIVCIGSLSLSGCQSKEKTEFTGNRAIVMNFVSSIEEDADSREIYKQLAGQISNWYGGEESTVEVKETTAAIQESIAQVDQTCAWTTALENYKALKNKPSMLENYLCRLEPGMYITGYDMPSGKYRVAVESSDHKINCIVLKEHERIQPGNRDDSNSKYGVYTHTLDLPDNTVVQLGRPTYFVNIGKITGKLSDDTDMSEEYMEGLSSTDLYLLAKCNKKPDVNLSGKVIKLYQDGAAISSGQDVFRIRTSKELQNQTRVEFTGKVSDVFESGDIKSAVIDVDKDSITIIK